MIMGKDKAEAKALNKAKGIYEVLNAPIYVEQTLTLALNGKKTFIALKQANDDAVSAGVFGAPYFIIDGEPFWGNDRRLQIERRLSQGAF